MKPKVVVAETIAAAGVAAIAADCEVDDAVGAERADLLDRLGDADGLVVRSATQVDEELLDVAPRLRVIGRAGIGVDNIDLVAATRRGILVVNAPNANTISAAEHTLALLLSQARNVAAADATLRSGAWRRNDFQGVELHGKTLGVIGLGRIGTLVAQRALSFGMRLISYDPFLSEDRGRRLGVEMVELEQLLTEADFITIHLPLTDDTRNLLDADGLAKTKPGVRIINVARGGIIDEEALADSVRTGHVAGAAIDVFATEPTTASPLFGLPQVVVTPHLGASTAEAQDKAGTDVAAAVAAALRGELVTTAVNLDLGPGIPELVQRHLPLAEALGKVFIAIADRMPSDVVVSAEGTIGSEPIQALSLAVIKGMLQVASSEPVSYVNAPTLAQRYGVSIALRTTEQATDYVSLIRVSGKIDDTEISVAGTVSQKGEILIEILGHNVELPLADHLLVVRNDDVPGMIGRIGTFVGDLGVNIADMVVGRPREGSDTALMGLVLGSSISDDDVQRLGQIEGVVEARYISL